MFSHSNALLHCSHSTQRLSCFTGANGVLHIVRRHREGTEAAERLNSLHPRPKLTDQFYLEPDRHVLHQESAAVPLRLITNLEQVRTVYQQRYSNNKWNKRELFIS